MALQMSFQDGSYIHARTQPGGQQVQTTRLAVQKQRIGRGVCQNPFFRLSERPECTGTRIGCYHLHDQWPDTSCSTTEHP
jgi:hypothetical protein